MTSAEEIRLDRALKMFDLKGDSPNQIRESKWGLLDELVARAKSEWSFGELLTLTFSPMGSRYDMLRMLRFRDGTVYVRTGCFLGTLEEFEESVHTSYNDVDVRAYRNRYRQQYEIAITAMRALLTLSESS